MARRERVQKTRQTERREEPQEPVSRPELSKRTQRVLKRLNGR